MLVLRPESATTNAKDAFIQADVVPLQTERFALSKAQRERDGPPCAVPMLGGHLQETADLWNVVRLHLFL
jgi:hypothetical protein